MKIRKASIVNLLSVGGIVWILSLLLVSTIFPTSSLGGEVVKKQMIAGKEWRVEKVEEEPNTYMVYWGDKKVKWGPKPWMADYLLKEGPLFHDRWIQSGLPYPWDSSLEERLKLDANEIMKKSIEVCFYCCFAKDRADRWAAGVVNPKEQLRTKKGTEYTTAYYLPEMKERLPEELRGVLAKKYLYIMTYPEDIAGMSGLNYSYFDPKRPDDIWFYLPSVRKVRRFSEGSRQDYMPGTLARNEDFVITRPIHNYKLVGMELYEPNYDHYGFTGKRWEETNPKRIDFTGDPCWVIEETPYKEKWWAAKTVKKISMKTFWMPQILNYDEKGELIRYGSQNAVLPDPARYPYYISWETWMLKELNTGFKGYTFPGNTVPISTPFGTFEYEWNADIPERAMSVDSLTGEYVTKLFFWR